MLSLLVRELRVWSTDKSQQLQQFCECLIDFWSLIIDKYEKNIPNNELERKKHLLDTKL